MVGTVDAQAYKKFQSLFKEQESIWLSRCGWQCSRGRADRHPKDKDKTHEMKSEDTWVTCFLYMAHYPRSGIVGLKVFKTGLE